MTQDVYDDRIRDGVSVPCDYHNRTGRKAKRMVKAFMNLIKTRSIEIPLTMDHFKTADSFIEEWMKQNHIGNKAILETKLLFESHFYELIEQGFDQNTMLTIKAQRTFGEYNIKLAFEGKAYVRSKRDDDISPEMMIVKAYNDKVGYRYRMGYNSIRIVVKRNYSSSLVYCFIAILLAMLVSTLLHAFLSFDKMTSLDNHIILPLIKQFENAMLMIGAPVTFFSLIKNLTDNYIISENSSSGRKLQLKSILTSVIAILLALVTGVLIASLMSSHQGYLKNAGSFASGLTITEFIESLVPSSIFEPFETYMPFPIIIVALMLTYALCSIGEYFSDVHRIINICLTLFSKMLNVVMFTLPFFCFLAVISMLMVNGTSDILVLLRFVLVIAASLVVIAVFYLIRLLIGKVALKPFVRYLPQLLWENLKIGSAIDAVPFNIRYCSRHYGFNRKRLSAKLPILAQTNLDGNCYLIMLISMIFIYLLGIEISWLQIVGIAFLVLFLSVGAPNQPGSMLIGMLIITFYLQADELISIAIFAEVFFGSIQNSINVLGDIVTVAIEEQKHRQSLKSDK